MEAEEEAVKLPKEGRGIKKLIGSLGTRRNVVRFWKVISELFVNTCSLFIERFAN